MANQAGRNKTVVIDTKRAPRNENSLHRSLKTVLMISQCVGQVPVLGITGRSSKTLKFSWLAWRTLYCLVIAVSLTILCFIYLYRFAKYGTNLFLISTFVFYANGLTSTLLFLKLATDWPRLMEKCRLLEISMRSYGWPKHLHFRLNFMTYTFIALATTDYVLVKWGSFSVASQYKPEDQDLWEYYITIILYNQVFDSVPYSFVLGLYLHVINFLATYAWSLTDLYIVLLSSALAVRFRQISERLQMINQLPKVPDKTIWETVREDYIRLNQFAKELDDVLSYIVLLSYASNLFSIMMQLFNSLREMKNTIQKVYFFFSFGFVITRTVLVTIYGAWIYDESKEPIDVLNSVSTDAYNVEIRRFVEHVMYDTVAIGGKGFFVVTRGLLLNMAGAIVTYELVLIQFNQNLLTDAAAPAQNMTFTLTTVPAN